MVATIRQKDLPRVTAARSGDCLMLDGPSLPRGILISDFLGLLDSFTGATATDRLLAAIAGGALYVQLTQDITLTAQIDLPANFTLDFNRHVINQGANVTQLFTMADSAQILDGRIDGHGGTFTGKTISIVNGNYQRLLDVDIVNSDSFCLDFAADKGQNFVWLGGSAQRFVSTNPAIRTVSESQTSGGRYFNNINMNGGWGYDLGGHYTVIQGGSMLSLVFRSTSSYVKITDTRIASAPTIIGANHKIDAVFDAGVTLGDGTGTYPNGTSLVQSLIYAQFGLTITDNSKSNTNTIERAPSNTLVVYMAGGNNPALQLFQAGSEFFEIVSNASNQPSLRSRNTLPVNFGIDTTDYFALAADGGLISLGVTGGSKGAHTANATALYVKGAPVGAIELTLSQMSLAAANTDHALPVVLPDGYTRFRVQSVSLSNPTGDIHTGTIGIFTATGGAGGGGQTIAADQAITITTATANANNNGMQLTITNVNTEVYTPASFGVANTLQVRTGTLVAASAVDVSVFIQPLL